MVRLIGDQFLRQTRRVRVGEIRRFLIGLIKHFPSTTGTFQIFTGERREQTSIFGLVDISAAGHGFDGEILDPIIGHAVQMHERSPGQCLGIGFGRQHFRDFHSRAAV